MLSHPETTGVLSGRRRGGLAVLRFLAVAAWVATGARALAATAPLDTQGFSGYAPGPLAGQFGWLHAEAGLGPATVITEAGNKLVEVEKTGPGDHHWAVPLGTSLPTGRFMLVDWEMRVAATGATNGGYGPFFGVEMYDYPSTYDGTLGSFGVDATTGEVLTQAAGSGALTATGRTVALDSWHSYAILLDFTLDKYSVFLDGTRLAVINFVDGPALNQLTDADIVALRANVDAASTAMTGAAYFDDFRILDGIPGDFDVDADVDAADLAPWRTSFGGQSAASDADGDGDVDGNDFVVWQRNLSADFNGAVAAHGALPEPGAALLAIAAIASRIDAGRRAPARRC
ncbi:MAG TPA: hypothetical protein VEQ85_12250 [Lacipirellulaceae bacterium]|nr:hypothetical protein [Lacipirellulaceae bacterium]